MSRLSTPRYQTAKAQPPGNPILWKAAVNDSDVFAYSTANDQNGTFFPKGGPFGAQLWLYNPNTDQYLMVGTPETANDSNAVVFIGRASAHAEAENLSPEKRAEVIGFLEDHKGEGWKVIQVSSGESCPSCRSKQVLFAEELMGLGLIEKGDFHVVFKATYDQTRRDATFNDAPFDQTFRAIDELGVLEDGGELFDLEAAIKANPETLEQCNQGELVFNAVNFASSLDTPDSVLSLLKQAGDQPFAVVVAKDGSIMSYATDTRDLANDGQNLTEKTAIVSALYGAAAKLREGGTFESWNLEGATLYTNIRDIGPKAYAESLWYNLSSIQVVAESTSDLIDSLAEEAPGIPNRDLFGKVAADYDSAASPIQVTFMGDPDEASAAHLLWKARLQRDGILNDQVDRLRALEKAGLSKIFFTSGAALPANKVIATFESNVHYDGKQAEPDRKPA
ncbi:MAG TPA: hypothetical protein PLK94_06450 [Alphaproteobacteria bacterium]|nr:hypothetical protein [Alphaproteobacteria bacterium]HOO50912.1 hypothetical protein [Alphaproteobacteria bacterium]